MWRGSARGDLCLRLRRVLSEPDRIALRPLVVTAVTLARGGRRV
jgi:hypothetical protein